MYHERQSRQMCLVHALNCLVQEKRFTSASLDDICYTLNEHRWMNPHRSWLGLGNYDANVLMYALTLCDLQATWFDSRLPVDRINLSSVHAMVFNVPSRSMIPFMNGRHWYTVLRRDDGRFVNLDSKMAEPEELNDIMDYAKEILGRTHDKNQLILVTKGDSETLVRHD